MSRPAPPAAAPIEYPSGDGKPMAENDAQRNAIIYGIDALRLRFSRRPDVYVSGDLLIYYEEGNPRASVAPDVFVVFGVEDRERLNYKLWEEGPAPAFVLEVASPSTWREDLDRKRSLYARLGVEEYYQFDPGGDLLPARLLGWRWTPAGYVRQVPVSGSDGALRLPVRTLDLELRAAPGREMRFRDPATGRDLLSYSEEAAAREAEAAAREVEAAAREAAEARAAAAEARVAELEAMLRRRAD